ncbi:MAG TPA: ester cyclase [Steroidobacter sp.]|nr:ester cyclase [Steroidobacter sp.]
MRLFAVLAAAVLSLAAMSVQADPEANTQIAKRVFLEKMGQGRFDKLEEIYGPGFVAHGGSRDYTLEEDNESGKAWRAAFPDLKVSVERTVANDELVAVHWSAAGTNTVAAAGTPGQGKKARIEGMTFFRFADGRIVEEWSIIDVAALNRQLM